MPRHRLVERVLGQRHRFAQRVAQQHALGGLAAHHALVARLEPAQARAVHADVAERLRRQLAHRVVAPALGQEEDPGQRELAHAARYLGVELARHPDELAIGVEPLARVCAAL